jgi:hypothetical protein
MEDLFAQKIIIEMSEGGQSFLHPFSPRITNITTSQHRHTHTFWGSHKLGNFTFCSTIAIFQRNRSTVPTTTVQSTGPRRGLCISSCQMKKSRTFRFLKKVQSKFERPKLEIWPQFNWGFRRFDFSRFYPFRFIFDKRILLRKIEPRRGRTWVQPLFNRSLAEVWPRFLRD